MIDNVTAMISPYVEKDPTKFCTYEEFEKGIATLKQFCLLRAESVSGQLDGTIGSTSDTQQNDTLIDAEDLQINDMGSMSNTMSFGSDKPDDNIQKPQADAGTNSDILTDELPSESSDTSAETDQSDIAVPQMPDGQMPIGEQGVTPPDFESGFSDVQMQRPDDDSKPSDDRGQAQKQNTVSASAWIFSGVSVLILAAGLVFALTFKRRK